MVIIFANNRKAMHHNHRAIKKCNLTFNLLTTLKYTQHLLLLYGENLCLLQDFTNIRRFEIWLYFSKIFCLEKEYISQVFYRSKMETYGEHLYRKRYSGQSHFN